MTQLRPNDPAQYDELADQWWDASGGFAALHWLAASRAEHIPPARHPGAVLVDLACGGGLMGPHVARLGYRHVGVDLGLQGLRVAREHGVLPVRGSVLAVPLADGCADVVVAGEILEHVEDDVGVLAECARVLRPGGTLVFLEHGLAPTRRLRAVQRVADATVWPLLAGGCHTAGDPVGLIEQAGFEVTALRRLRFPGTRVSLPATPHVLGSARRPD